MSINTVEIIELEEKHFVGLPVTVPFQRFDAKRINEVSRIFHDRKHEISNVKNEDEYVCPFFSNDQMFTYVYCMEVSEIFDIPDEMICFSVPSQRYAKVRSADQDPYAIIKSYLKEAELENNDRSMALEYFRFGEKQHVNNADIYVPIK